MPQFAPLSPPQRVLLGPGPSEIAPSVLRALSKPTVGHLDPEMLAAMDEVRSMLRLVYGTRNEWTLAVSGTGTSGMESTLVNLLRPGDEVLVGIVGYFGKRLVDIAERCGAKVTVHEGEWGRPLDLDDLRAAAGGRKYRLVAVVHSETSTGVLQELEGFRALADELGAMLLVDAVTSLGCVPLEVDALGIDAVYSCSQKGLSCTPGLSPVSFSETAREAASGREDRAASFYLDANLLMDYWSGRRGYHHTASSNLFYGLHEALRLVLEEGLERRHARHVVHGRALAAGLEAMGLELVVPAADRLPQLTAVRIPDGVEDAKVRKRLLADFDLEIGGGLGPFAGQVWRIGLMGAGSTKKNVVLCLAALRAALVQEGFRAGDDGVEAAQAALAAS